MNDALINSYENFRNESERRKIEILSCSTILFDKIQQASEKIEYLMLKSEKVINANPVGLSEDDKNKIANINYQTRLLYEKIRESELNISKCIDSIIDSLDELS